MSDDRRVLIVEARFYDKIADGLAEGVIEILDKAGVSHDRLEVPGAFEVPAAIRFAIRAMEEGTSAKRYAGFIGLGCVIRGETDHYDHICRESSRALMDLSVIHGAALGFGILTCETWEQAVVRADPRQKNKGADAANACLRMMELKQQFRLASR